MCCQPLTLNHSRVELLFYGKISQNMALLYVQRQFYPNASEV